MLIDIISLIFNDIGIWLLWIQIKQIYNIFMNNEYLMVYN